MVYRLNQKEDPMGKSHFTPSLQISSFRKLEASDLITNLKIHKQLRGNYYWTFNLCEIEFEYDDKKIDLDFRKYSIKVCYTKKDPPRVYIVKPQLINKAKHVYSNGSLCLYKPMNWQWKNNMSFGKDLFPNICTWIYFYEIWKENGNWIGEEAVHDVPQEIMDKIMRRGMR